MHSQTLVRLARTMPSNSASSIAVKPPSPVAASVLAALLNAWSILPKRARTSSTIRATAASSVTSAATNSTSPSAEGLDGLSPPAHGATADRHGGTTLEEGLRGREADARRPTGHEGDPAGEVEVCVSDHGGDPRTERRAAVGIRGVDLHARTLLYWTAEAGPLLPRGRR